MTTHVHPTTTPSASAIAAGEMAKERQHAREGMSIRSKAGLVLIGFLIIAGALLFTEHRAHVLGLFVWLPLLACPLMHFFMHGSHKSSRQPRPTE